MERILNASFSAGITALIGFWLVALVRNPPTEVSSDMLFGAVAVSLMAWVLGFLFCAVLLVPLIFAFEYGSHSFSLLLFVIVGFCVPAYLETMLSTVPVHGKTPALFEANNTGTIISIPSIGVIGSACAITAWRSLLKCEGKNAPNK